MTSDEQQDLTIYQAIRAHSIGDLDTTDKSTLTEYEGALKTRIERWEGILSGNAFKEVKEEVRVDLRFLQPIYAAVQARL